jgi:hypothetical protein
MNWLFVIVGVFIIGSHIEITTFDSYPFDTSINLGNTLTIGIADLISTTSTARLLAHRVRAALPTQTVLEAPLNYALTVGVAGLPISTSSARLRAHRVRTALKTRTVLFTLLNYALTFRIAGLPSSACPA